MKGNKKIEEEDTKEDHEKVENDDEESRVENEKMELEKDLVTDKGEIDSEKHSRTLPKQSILDNISVRDEQTEQAMIPIVH